MSRQTRWLKLALLCVLACTTAGVEGQAGRARASGAPTAATWAAPAMCRTTRSTRPTSASCRWPGDSRPMSSVSAPDYNLQNTPLMINGVLYATVGSRRDAVAIDAATGELLWMYRLDEGKRSAAAPRLLSGRDVAYWTDGQGDERIFMVTIGYQLVALEAKTGIPIQSFGQNGILDLKQNNDQVLDPITGEIGLNTGPVVAKDVVIVGAAHRAGNAPRSRTNAKGYIRGFDVKTGKRLWIFHTIPQPGEFGNETWEKDSWSYSGNAGVWGPFSVDEELETGVPARRTVDGRLFRWTPAGQQPLHRVARGGRPAHGEAQMALPVRPPRHLGLRPSVRADSGRRYGRRQAHQSRCGSKQAGFPLRVRSPDGRAGLADCRNAPSKRARCRANGIRRRSRFRPSPRRSSFRVFRKRT